VRKLRELGSILDFINHNGMKSDIGCSFLVFVLLPLVSFSNLWFRRKLHEGRLAQDHRTHCPLYFYFLMLEAIMTCMLNVESSAESCSNCGYAEVMRYECTTKINKAIRSRGQLHSPQHCREAEAHEINNATIIFNFIP
jgi:hypothetical protein